MNPLIYAHRGAQTFALENSMEAFEKAFQLGADGIELDVRLCKSGEIVVIHDFYLKRLTGISGLVRKRELSFIRNLDLISKNSFPKTKIPTMQQVLELSRSYNKLLNIDIKKGSLFKNRLEEKILKIISDFGMEEYVLISSYNPTVLKAVKTINTKIKTGFIYRNRPYSWLSNSKYYDSLHPNYRLVNQKHIALAQRKGKEIHVWTINDKILIKHFLEMEVDGIITNCPEIAIEAIHLRSTDRRIKS